MSTARLAHNVFIIGVSTLLLTACSAFIPYPELPESEQVTIRTPRLNCWVKSVDGRVDSSWFKGSKARVPTGRRWLTVGYAWVGYHYTKCAFYIDVKGNREYQIECEIPQSRLMTDGPEMDAVFPDGNRVAVQLEQAHCARTALDICRDDSDCPRKRDRCSPGPYGYGLCQ
jgi:hypothetical protein